MLIILTFIGTFLELLALNVFDYSIFKSVFLWISGTPCSLVLLSLAAPFQSPFLISASLPDLGVTQGPVFSLFLCFLLREAPLSLCIQKSPGDLAPPSCVSSPKDPLNFGSVCPWPAGSSSWRGDRDLGSNVGMGTARPH